MPENTVEHYTPSFEQLRPFQQIKCEHCHKIFSNKTNYNMHLEKHHRISVEQPSGEKSSCIRFYYCPGSTCDYWYGKENGKHFKNMKLLRQHYQKVHMAKRYECDECAKAFSTKGQLRKHKADYCGRAFACRQCGWSYVSMEALMTHCKRKSHNVRDVITLNKTKGNVAVLSKDSASDSAQISEEKHNCVESTEGKHEISVQTMDLVDNQDTSRTAGCSSQTSAGVQTDFFPNIPDHASNQDLNNALEDIHSMLRDIETQTEPLVCSSNNETHRYLDQMLAQSHMYTQTCDDFLSELGLADIQTQTYWPSPQRDEEKLQFTSTATSTNPCIHDELLVSTETQTSFTQCLLNSCTDADTSTPPSSFSGLYHTQHTQTCGEPLLESFDFGGQASDLMDGFQSTYTQT